MRAHIIETLNHAETMEEILTEILPLLERVATSSETGRLGYVGGIISSDGPEHIDRNLKVLATWTEALRNKHDFPIFSATDIFTDEIFARLPSTTQDEYQVFFRNLLQSGHVTDVFLTPRWEDSNGTRDEHETARNLGLQIHVITE